jgi:glycosyltransferase domain-containing protein
MTGAADLTIVLTLKDRAAFTHRWMSYANEVRFPFKVLIADGGADESVRGILSDKGRFPNLDYEYVRYPYDRTYSQYYAKAADVLSQVRTPLVVMADNDDFFVIDGLKECVDFMAEHREYSACGGQCASFWVGPAADDPAGTVHGKRVEWKVSSGARSEVAETGAQRISNLSRSANDVYYLVHRSDELARQFRLVRDFNPRDLFLVEQLITNLTAVAGKIKHLDTLYIARQLNAPGSSGGEHLKKHGGWFGLMLVPTWSEDFTKFVEISAAALAQADGISIGEARQCVVSSYRLSVAPSLLSELLDEPTVTTSMPLVVQLVRRLVRLPEGSLVRRMAQRLYRRTRWVSFDLVRGGEFLATRAPNAAREFDKIEAFLARTPQPAARGQAISTPGT